MNLLLRLLLVLWRAWRAPRLAPLAESVVPFRVLPTDLDLNRHMNNGRYLTLMDLGRVDLIVRSGMLGALRRRRWMPVIASQLVRYRRALDPFDRYELRTRVLGWNDRDLFVQQRFVRGGEVVALAVVRAVVRGPDGRVPPGEVAAEAGHPLPSPPLPPAVLAWLDAEEALVAAGLSPGASHG